MASILCRWSNRLELSPTGHSFRAYIINFQKHAQDTIFSHVPTSLTNYCFAAYEQRTLYGALVVTLAMLLHPYKLSFYHYYFIIIKHNSNTNKRIV